ncbi:cysG [Symbiodinium sp. CCMP2592]|nr:cysG [Symbiodinium sp. CCMP2592]
MLGNGGNMCYANSVLLSLAHMFRDRLDCLGAPLRSLLSKLLKPPGVRPSYVTKMKEWRTLISGWQQPHQQHDVAEFLMHLILQSYGLPVLSKWYSEGPLVEAAPRNDQGDGLILLPTCNPVQPFDTLQQCVQGWHQQLQSHYVQPGTDFVLLQLDRFEQRGTFVRKRRHPLFLNSGTLLLPTGPGDSQWDAYFIQALILHEGDTPVRGHYRAALVSHTAGAVRVCDDNRVPRLAVPADKIFEKVYVLLLSRLLHSLEVDSMDGVLSGVPLQCALHIVDVDPRPYSLRLDLLCGNVLPCSLPSLWSLSGHRPAPKSQCLVIDDHLYRGAGQYGGKLTLRRTVLHWVVFGPNGLHCRDADLVHLWMLARLPEDSGPDGMPSAARVCLSADGNDRAPDRADAIDGAGRDTRAVLDTAGHVPMTTGSQRAMVTSTDGANDVPVTSAGQPTTVAQEHAGGRQTLALAVETKGGQRKRTDRKRRKRSARADSSDSLANPDPDRYIRLLSADGRYGQLMARRDSVTPTREKASRSRSLSATRRRNEDRRRSAATSSRSGVAANSQDAKASTTTGSATATSSTTATSALTTAQELRLQQARREFQGRAATVVSRQLLKVEQAPDLAPAIAAYVEQVKDCIRQDALCIHAVNYLAKLLQRATKEQVPLSDMREHVYQLNREEAALGSFRLYDPPIVDGRPPGRPPASDATVATPAHGSPPAAEVPADASIATTQSEQMAKNVAFLQQLQTSAKSRRQAVVQRAKTLQAAGVAAGDVSAAAQGPTSSSASVPKGSIGRALVARDTSLASAEQKQAFGAYLRGTMARRAEVRERNAMRVHDKVPLPAAPSAVPDTGAPDTSSSSSMELR